MTQELTTTETKLFELAKPYLLVMNNALHTKEVVRFCFKLLGAEKGNRETVIAAAILHDVGWSQLPENLSIKMRIHNKDPEKIKIHEELGSRIAEDILRKMAFESSQINEIVEIIQGHDTRKTAISLNDAIVKDADKLSRYSPAFQTIWPTWGIRLNPDKHFHALEKGLKEWFFLSSSEIIAKEELSKRIEEFRSQCSPAIENIVDLNSRRPKPIVPDLVWYQTPTSLSS